MSVTVEPLGDDAPQPPVKRPFVLVHGAWHGGWCWRDVARLLRAAGHEVYALSLTGLADRSHLPAEGVDVDLHGAEIAGIIVWEELEGAVLVGHSYGGGVAMAAADRVPERIAALVLIDAGVPGVSDPLPPPVAPGPVIPPPVASLFALKPENVARVERLMTPQPLGCRRDYVPTGAWDSVPRRAFLACTRWPFAQRSLDTLDRLAVDPRWETQAVACGHDIMVDEPALLANYLLQFGR